MSLTNFFYEPFYTLSDFDRLFDEAFNARTSSLAPRGQNENGNAPSNRPMRPRCVNEWPVPSARDMCTDVFLA